MTHGKRTGLWLTLVVLCAPMSPGADKAVEDRRDPPLGVPDEDSITRATRTIRQTFAQEYAGATGIPQRAALGRRLLTEALATADDAAGRYVLLCEARELGAKSGDAATACRAIDQLARDYGVAPGEMTLAALAAAGRVTYAPPGQEALARCALAAADGALARDDYDLAPRLTAIAEGAAAKAKKVALLTEAQEKQKEITWAAREFAQAKAALTALAARPDDADARSAAGRFKCLVKGDWERGLPLLAEGSDAALKALAEKDLAAGSSGATVQAEVGDQWWEVGERQFQRARLACRGRAGYWYRRAAPALAGLTRTTVEKRLDELDAARNRELRLEPGLAAEVFEGQFGKSFAVRTDAAVDFDWPASGREGVPKGNFSIRWTGLLRAPAAGKYALTLHVNESARVFVDDKLVLDEPKGAQKRKGTTASVTLAEGLHPIRVEFTDSGGLSKIRLMWQPPGAKGEEVIPAKAFLHEMGMGR